MLLGAPKLTSHRELCQEQTVAPDLQTQHGQLLLIHFSSTLQFHN